MNTPICDFVEEYSQKHFTRAHMPGHKGHSPLPCGFEAAYAYDITEIKGADALFEAEGIISESEKNASRLFNTNETIYSCGGSTACIQAMLAAVCKAGGKVIAARNAHRAFISACSLLDLDVKWLFPEASDSIVTASISPEAVESALKAYPAACVYITSPDYPGYISDIRGISRVCRKYGARLLVDNAHGAYTAFLEPSLHPMALGADMCCDSAHKTLPVLTGGAYLHSAQTIPLGRAKECMSLFCSTSPSYLILQSLDMCNKYLEKVFPAALNEFIPKLSLLKERLSGAWDICDTEPLKLTIRTASAGLYGTQLADILRDNNIECEYADSSYIVMMLSPMNTDNDLSRIEAALSAVKMPRMLINEPAPLQLPPPKQAMSVREAVFAENILIPAADAVGRVCGRAVTACPPGIAVSVPGEIISREAAELMLSMGTEYISIVK